MTDYETRWLSRFVARHAPLAEPGCWMYRGKGRCGRERQYGKVSFQGKTWRVHRLIWTLLLGRPIGKGRILAHSCDNPLCWRPDHLRETTQSENMAECARKGRHSTLFGRRTGDERNTPAA